jgi:formylmethanofuran dehydrogenase subunit B
MLERGDVDACLLVGTLDYPTIESFISPTLRFTTAVYGVHQPSTAFRMDDIPIRLRSFLPTDYPSDSDVLKAIEDQMEVD